MKKILTMIFSLYAVTALAFGDTVPLTTPKGWESRSVIAPQRLSRSYAKKPVRGIASWYSERDRGVGKYTASGDIFDDSKKTCAAWNYDFGVYLKVTNPANGKSVICRVNDRGPSKKFENRVLDLSKSAFAQIADPKKGLIRVSFISLGKVPARNL